MPLCTWCHKVKPVPDFERDKTSRTGVRCRCRECERARRKELRKDKPGHRAAYMKKWREDHPNTNREIQRRYRVQNADKRAAIDARKRLVRDHELSRRDEPQIILKYAEARQRSRDEGVAYHVDHQVPLNGENVCGLHVSWNMEVMRADLNIAKSNKF